MIFWKKITILVHTKNRPEFLLRLISYYDEMLGAVGTEIIILDCSDDDNFAKISDELDGRKHPLTIRMLHHPQSATIPDRIAEALRLISTPYVLLAADDDFYFFDWLRPAVDLLDFDSSYGVVYGHTVRFELARYEPLGKFVRFDIAIPNPPARWLEGDSAIERLKELGRSNWATTGWYALQRTEMLSVIVECAKEFHLDGYHFERLLVFCQAALYKTKKIDYIYLARQLCDEHRPLYSFKLERERLDDLMKVCAHILSRRENIEMKTAIAMVEDAFREEILALKKNDSRKHLRFIADRLPFLRELKTRASRSLATTGVSLDPLLPDSRFPSAPKINSDHPKILAIRRFTEARR